jgi:hypothetical protein
MTYNPLKLDRPALMWIHSLPTHIGRSIWADPMSRVCLSYWILLWFTISQVVTNSKGFSYDPAPLISIPLQVSIVVFVSKLLPSKVSGPLQTLQVFSALLLTIPAVVLAFSNSPNMEFRYGFLALIYCLLNQILISFFTGERCSSSFEKRKISLSLSGIAYCLIILVSTCIFIALLSGVLSTEFATFTDIYSKRAEIKEILTNPEFRYLAYVVGWTGGILIPLAFYFGLALRNIYITILSIVLCFTSYFISSEKWVVASCFFVFLLHVISTSGDRNGILTHVVVRTFNCFIILLISIQSLFPNSLLVDLGVRRALLDPSIMLQYYVKFNAIYPPQLWSDSIISRYFINDESAPVSRIIGDRFFNIPSNFFYPRTSSTNATSGSIADSIAQGGILGFFAISLLIVGVYYIFHFLSIGRSHLIVFVLSGLVFVMLVEGTFHTLLLSRGLILIFIVFLLLPKVNSSQLRTK